MPSRPPRERAPTSSGPRRGRRSERAPSRPTLPTPGAVFPGQAGALSSPTCGRTCGRPEERPLGGAGGRPRRTRREGCQGLRSPPPLLLTSSPWPPRPETVRLQSRRPLRPPHSIFVPAPKPTWLGRLSLRPPVGVEGGRNRRGGQRGTRDVPPSPLDGHLNFHTSPHHSGEIYKAI